MHFTCDKEARVFVSSCVTGGTSFSPVPGSAHGEACEWDGMITAGKCPLSSQYFLVFVVVGMLWSCSVPVRCDPISSRSEVLCMNCTLQCFYLRRWRYSTIGGGDQSHLSLQQLHDRSDIRWHTSLQSAHNNCQTHFWEPLLKKIKIKSQTTFVFFSESR